MDRSPYPRTSPHEQFEFGVLPPYRDFLKARSEVRRFEGALRALHGFAERTWYYYDAHGDTRTLGNRREPETFIRYLSAKYSRPELSMVWEDAVSGEPRFRIKSRILRPLGEGRFRLRNGAKRQDVPKAQRGRSIEADLDSMEALLEASETQRALYLDRHDMFADEIFKRVVRFWATWLDRAPVHRPK